MRLHAIYEESEDSINPINMAKAIIDFSSVDENLDTLGEDFLEMVDYLNVKARSVRNEMHKRNLIP